LSCRSAASSRSTHCCNSWASGWVCAAHRGDAGAEHGCGAQRVQRTTCAQPQPRPQPRAAAVCGWLHMLLCRCRQLTACSATAAATSSSTAAAAASAATAFACRYQVTCAACTRQQARC
jgi:hypothetical protein